VLEPSGGCEARREFDNSRRGKAVKIRRGRAAVMDASGPCRKQSLPRPLPSDRWEGGPRL